jgi:hypothetical protein
MAGRQTADVCGGFLTYNLELCLLDQDMMIQCLYKHLLISTTMHLTEVES